MHHLIIVAGPTASGKSALGVKLAKKFNGIVISADSRQVYRGLNIGTGKITKQEMAGVPHFLLDVTAPRGQYTVDRYVRDVSKVLKKIPATTPVFLVGGSPFYIDALTKPNSYSPVPPNPALRRRLDKLPTIRLIAILRRLNPERLKNIDTANRRRLIRAIEIASDKSKPLVAKKFDFLVLKLGVAITKPKLHRNIDRRVDIRLRQGMIAEVVRLHRQGLSWSRLEAFGLEYRFLSLYLQDQLTKAEAVTKLKSAIRDFAKRQMTWWKRDVEIHWVVNAKTAERIVRGWMNNVGDVTTPNPSYHRRWRDPARGGGR